MVQDEKTCLVKTSDPQKTQDKVIVDSNLKRNLWEDQAQRQEQVEVQMVSFAQEEVLGKHKISG